MNKYYSPDENLDSKNYSTPKINYAVSNNKSNITQKSSEPIYEIKQSQKLQTNNQEGPNPIYKIERPNNQECPNPIYKIERPNNQECPNPIYEIERPKKCSPCLTSGGSTIRLSDNQEGTKSICEISYLEEKTPTAWPVVVMASIGLGLVIYTAIGPNIKANRIVFGFIFLLLWTIMWCLILWVVWKGKQYKETWWLLIIALLLAIIFFLVIVIFAM